MAPTAGDVAADVARRSHGRLVAYLASISGDIAGAEDALSEAFVAALRTWPASGVPARPESWLITAARRNIIGTARRRAVATRAAPALGRLAEAAAQTGVEASGDGGIVDRRLELLFACAHPAIDESMHSPLMLQTVLGLDASRMASVFLVPAATMGQRLVRTKAKILQAGIPFAVPSTPELPQRLGAVLDAIYAAYGTGWDDPVGFDAPRAGLTDEAIRLASVLVEVLPHEPEVLGLCALLLHSNARRGARRNGDGAFVSLSEQDVDQWSRDEMARAEAHLAVAVALGRIGPYQLQGAIQSLHNRRAIDGHTDWQAIATLYDGLVVFTPSVGAYVARAAAHAELHGPQVGLAMLDEIEEMHRGRADRYQPYHATRAHLLAELGECEAAGRAARRAVELTADPTVRVHLVARHDLRGHDLHGLDLHCRDG